MREKLPSQIAIRNASGATIGQILRLATEHSEDDSVTQRLSDWRNRFGSYFMTQFESTPERTRTWLHDTVLPDSSRGFFFVQNSESTIVGHIGVLDITSPHPELDNMIRGDSQGDPQLMRWAEAGLIKSLFTASDIDEVKLRVFSSNWIPISIHQSIGFRINRRSTVTRLTNLGGEVQYLLDSSEGQPQTYKCLHMSLSRNDFNHFVSTNTNWDTVQ
jgi:hypothetical protein